jgi:acyl-CoA dehydrogenase
MDFAPNARTLALHTRLAEFMQGHVLPAEPVFREQIRAGNGHTQPPIAEELKAIARSRGLWNLFLPHENPWHEDPLTNVEYAPLAELTGRSLPLGPEVINCAAPDTGNMELLTMFGTAEQQHRWLKPLLDGEIRSAYIMTEPHVASSDASNITTTIRRDGDHYVLDGHKWWISNAHRERCTLGIVLGVTDAGADRHRRHSMLLVPMDTPGITIVRDLEVFGYNPWESHVEMIFDEVRVPAANLLGEEGGGFAMTQARLGPGRIHHCMRQVGAAERALALLVERAGQRTTFGTPLVEQSLIQDWIAQSRIEIDQARLYTMYAAWLMDTVGNKAAASQISGIKVAVPRMAQRVVERAIQAFGAAGVSQDFPLAHMYTDARVIRIADGPDEVHARGVARTEIKRQSRARETDGLVHPVELSPAR